MKKLRDLTQEEVIAMQDAANIEAGLSDEAKLALALHDNMLVLGMLNDFIRLVDILDLDECRIREVRDFHLTKTGKAQQEGSDKFRKRLKLVLNNNIDECIDIINKIEEGRLDNESMPRNEH